MNGLIASQHPSITSITLAHIATHLYVARAASSASREARPQNTSQTARGFLVRRHTRLRYSRLDQTSSYARTTSTREITAVTMQRKHHAPTTVPCMTTNTA